MEWRHFKNPQPRARGQWHHLAAPSLDAFAEYAQGVTHADHEAFGNDASQKPPEPEWDYGLGFDGAVRLATFRQNWPDGEARLAEYVSKARARLASHFPARRVALQEAGHSVQPARFAAGDPRCMFASRKGTQRSRPSVAIALNMAAPHWVQAAQFAALAGASVALAGALSQRGYRVQAFSFQSVVALSSTDGKPSQYERVLITIPLFSPAQPFNVRRVAFQAAHPACNRRLGFAAIERGGKALKELASGYGLHEEKGGQAVADYLRDHAKARHLITLPNRVAGDESIRKVWERVDPDDMGATIKFVLEAAMRQGVRL